MFDRFDLVIRNGTLVWGSGRRQADLAVAGGRIVAISEREPGDRGDHGAHGALGEGAAEEFDATGLFVLPGVIDGHVHFREPGLEHKETWLTGSRAAVHGGVTTVLEMPNTMPPTRTRADAQAKLATAKAGAYCDFGIFGLLDQDGGPAARELIESGLVCGLKVFLGPSTGDLAPPPDGQLVELLRHAGRAGLRTAFHAEAATTLRWSEAAVAHRSDARAHLEGRPAKAEVDGIDHAGRVLSAAGAAGHILHLSAAEGIDAVRRWRSRGVDLTCEVTPQHMFLPDSAYEQLGGLAKVNPPLRGEPHASALRAALAEGLIECVASDHAPHAPDEKSSADIRAVEAGVAGVETLLPLMLTAVAAGWLSLERLVAACAEGPARVWGLGPAKGTLELGADADLVVVDLQHEGLVRGSELHGLHPLTLFEGRDVHGAVVATVVRGRVVVRAGELRTDPGWGRPAGISRRSA